MSTSKEAKKRIQFRGTKKTNQTSNFALGVFLIIFGLIAFIGSLGLVIVMSIVSYENKDAMDKMINEKGVWLILTLGTCVSLIFVLPIIIWKSKISNICSKFSYTTSLLAISTYAFGLLGYGIITIIVQVYDPTLQSLSSDLKFAINLSAILPYAVGFFLHSASFCSVIISAANHQF